MVYSEVQYVFRSDAVPNKDQFQLWLETALLDVGKDVEIVIRIVDEVESAFLNEQYRKKKGPTNILSFPFEAVEVMDSDLLGDLVICAPVVEKEAIAQHKNILHHWAHMVIHGVLHLLGDDHIDAGDAARMEAKEIEILKKLNITNPYEEI
jgi:probable rRNA maturation factor